MFLRKTLFLYLCLLLVGCASLTGERLQCPKTVIVAEFSKTVEFQEKTPLRVEIDSVTPSCTEGTHQILMDLRLRFTSIRPLELLHSPLTIAPSYFVAVVDVKGNLFSLSHHEVEMVFEEKKQTAVSFQRLLETIPSPDATVYLGFTLNEEQLDFLRQERHKKVNDSRARPH